MNNQKKIYFASDMHFGAPDKVKSRQREQIFIRWLDEIAGDAEELFLLGDVFDFWFEYKKAVPMGFTRVLGKLAGLSDAGVRLHYFAGNHDLWLRGYLEEELNAKVYHKPTVFTLQEKKFLIGHGDGLGPGDRSYKMMKKVFVHPVARWLFRWIHPDWGIRLAQYLSLKNKYISGEELDFQGEDNEALILYCKERLAREHFDYFVFGHRHLMLEIPLNKESVYINTGDWIRHFSYAELYEGKMALKQFILD